MKGIVGSLRSWKVAECTAWCLGRTLGAVCIALELVSECRPTHLKNTPWQAPRLSPHRVCKQTFHNFIFCSTDMWAATQKSQAKRGALPLCRCLTNLCFSVFTCEDVGQNLVLENAINELLWNKFWPVDIAALAYSIGRIETRACLGLEQVRKHPCV